MKAIVLQFIVKVALVSIGCLFGTVAGFSYGRLSAVIVDEKGEALPGAQFEIQALGIGAVADINGSLVVPKIPAGTYWFEATFVGYATIRQKIIMHDDELLELKIVLKEKASELEEVVVTGVSTVQEIRKAPFHVNVLDVKPLQAQSTPVVSLVNQIAGVRVREEGGMGSAVNIMLNGIGGKGVRILMDNIPIDLLGSGAALNNLPVNMIERVEIYKGVIPVKFGSDALGGVINVVPKAMNKDFVDASLTYGSWNTQQATLRMGTRLGQDIGVSVNGFYNHSDNNYWMHNVDVLVDELGNEEKADARRFHDKYTSALGEAVLSIENKSWADMLRMNISFSDTHKDWQHGITAETPWGKAFSEEQNVNVAVTWKKSGMLHEKLDLSVVGGYNHKDQLFIDTAARVYYWNNKYITNQLMKGESGFFSDGRTPDKNIDNTFGRTHWLYTLNDVNEISLTTLFTRETLSGHDERGTVTYGTDPLAGQQTMLKNYAGLSWERHVWDDRITNIASLKHFYTKAKIADIASDNSFQGFEETTSSGLGYGDALKCVLAQAWSATVGYEYTLRQPDALEIFGDYVQVGPSAGLRPERSHNINAGLRYNRTDRQGVSGEANAFFRATTDRIFLVTTQAFTLPAYMNLQNTRTKGVEAEVRYRRNHFTAYANGTYQDIRLESVDENGTIKPRYVGARVPNVPYLFGNTGLTLTIPNVFVEAGSLQFSYGFNYVHRFFLSWEIDGNKSTKADIPAQNLHNTSVAYLFPQERASISVECRNFTDQRAYDNYQVEKPGRSVYVKLRMYLTKP